MRADISLICQQTSYGGRGIRLFSVYSTPSGGKLKDCRKHIKTDIFQLVIGFLYMYAIDFHLDKIAIY